MNNIKNRPKYFLQTNNPPHPPRSSTTKPIVTRRPSIHNESLPQNVLNRYYSAPHQNLHPKPSSNFRSPPTVRQQPPKQNPPTTPTRGGATPHIAAPPDINYADTTHQSPPLCLPNYINPYFSAPPTTRTSSDFSSTLTCFSPPAVPGLDPPALPGPLPGPPPSNCSPASGNSSSAS